MPWSQPYRLRCTPVLPLRSTGSDQTGQGSLPLRQGRGIPWIAEALEPLHATLNTEQLHQLALAIRSTTGIEALVWLTDVAGLDRSQATHLMHWAAQALLHSAVNWAPPPANEADARR